MQRSLSWRGLARAAAAVAAGVLLCGHALPALSADFAPPPLFEPPLPTRATPGPTGFAGGVTYLPDVSYKTLTGWRPLKLDLYLPPEDGRSRHPVVVWIHGGAYEMGNPRADWTWGDWRLVLARLAARGYVVVAPTYRLSAEAPHPAALQDVQDAVRFVRAHAGLWQADPDRVIAWGLSAGGGLAVLAGTACTLQGQAVGGSEGACVQGVVDWFGAASFDTAMADMPPIRRFLGCSAGPCTDAQRASADALARVRPGLPPFLMQHGGADPLVRPEQSVRLDQALQGVGVPHELKIYPGLGHGFDGATPQQLETILQQAFDGIDHMSGRAAKETQR